jgi:hypothetical protein
VEAEQSEVKHLYSALSWLKFYQVAW